MNRPLYFRSRFWWTAFASWFALLFILSSFSGPNFDGPEIEHMDKVLHLVYFAAGGVCMMLGLFFGAPARIDSGMRRFLVVVLAISLIGAFDEWHQTFTAGRQGADVYDWLADTLGGLLAGAAGFVVPARLRDK